MIKTEKVNKQYGRKEILKNIEFSVAKGECFGVIGPNGSGKSTLLKLISGVEPVSSGEIFLKGQEIKQYTSKELARWIAVLQQEALPTIGFTVREVIEMGRFPFQNWIGEDNIDVEVLMNSILEKMNLTSLSNRPLEQLSGGERQRVGLAKTMAQSPQLLMLDEPTTYLDIGHQIQLMDRIRQWQLEEGMTVVAVLHDLNLAALYCDRLLLLHHGEVIAIGKPEEMIDADLIERVYGVRPIIMKHPKNDIPQIILEGEVMTTEIVASNKVLNM